MTDDLMKRLDALVEDLGEGRACWGHEYISAAVDAMDRIEALEAKLAKAADVLDWALIAWDEHWVHGLNMQGDWVHDARATLAELTGGKNDL